ncbi:hypothetical protein ACISSW_28970, partial [Escherichia coli]
KKKGLLGGVLYFPEKIKKEKKAQNGTKTPLFLPKSPQTWLVNGPPRPQALQRIECHTDKKHDGQKQKHARKWHQRNHQTGGKRNCQTRKGYLISNTLRLSTQNNSALKPPKTGSL